MIENLFWFTDCQNDFMLKNGKLHVPKAELIRPALKKLNELAIDNNIKSVKTLDYHAENSKEISSSPDFINTFPEHCMENTEGFLLIPEVQSLGLLHSVHYLDEQTLLEEKIYNFINTNVSNGLFIYKDKFDVFEGNPHTDKIVRELNPKKVFGCGVCSNVCVDQAILGLAKRGYKVYVIIDAIMDLPNIPMQPIVDNWVKLGITPCIINDELPEYAQELYEMFKLSWRNELAKEGKLFPKFSNIENIKDLIKE